MRKLLRLMSYKSSEVSGCSVLESCAIWPLGWGLEDTRSRAALKADIRDGW